MNNFKGNIKIVRNNASVDALIMTKDQAIPSIAKRFDLPLSLTAFIGDEVTDIPVMRTPGISFVAAPSNAQARVKETVLMMNGYVSPFEVFQGFLDFYNQARQRNISLIVSDKDGVLQNAGDMSYGSQFAALATMMGLDSAPYVSVLTGSGIDQNYVFMKKYGLTDALSRNSAVVRNPYLLIAEAGAIHVNILTGETINYVHEMDSALLRQLKGGFSRSVLDCIAQKVLPEHGFLFTTNYDDQHGKVFLPVKESMLTVNIPRSTSQHPKYRKTQDSERFRDQIVSVMEDFAKRMKLPYEIL